MPECKHDWYSIGVARHKCSKCDLTAHDCDDDEANDESWITEDNNDDDRVEDLNDEDQFFQPKEVK